MENAEPVPTTASMAKPGLAERKLTLVDAVVQWICQFNEFSENIVARLEDLSTDIASLHIWSSDADGDRLLTVENIKCFEVDQPRRGETNTESTTVVDDDIKKENYIPKIFAMKTDQVLHARYAYGQSVESATQNLTLIENKRLTLKRQATAMLCENITKFRKEFNSLQEEFHNYASGVLNSNKRPEMSDIAVRGPQDERIMKLLADLERNLQNSKMEISLDKKPALDVSCVWLHTRQLLRKATSFVKMLSVITQVIDKCLQESYSLWLWADYGCNKILTELLDNRRKLTALVEATEMRAIDMISNKKLEPLAMEIVEFPTSPLDISIKVSKVDVDKHMSGGKSRYQCFIQLEQLKHLSFPVINDYLVGSTIVKNKMRGLKVEDTSTEIPIDQLVILQLSGDRWIHIFRSHEDVMPLRSIYCLKMVPESHMDGNEDIVELKIAKSNSGSLLANVFTWEPQPVTFSFTSNDDSVLWKRLIRYSCLEQDPAFDKLGGYVIEQMTDKQPP